MRIARVALAAPAERAFAVLDPEQQDAARRLLDERGITAPGAEKKPPARDDAAGVPLEP